LYWPEFEFKRCGELPVRLELTVKLGTVVVVAILKSAAPKGEAQFEFDLRMNEECLKRYSKRRILQNYIGSVLPAFKLGLKLVVLGAP